LGSQSLAKLEAVRRGLAPFFGAVEVEQLATQSGVSEQPIGFEEIIEGARRRARFCYAAGACDLAAGIEDGLAPIPGAATGYMNIGCCALYDGAEDYLGLSAGFEYPPECVERALAARFPVGDSFDEIFQLPEGWADPGPGAGNIGRLTRGVLTRADYGAQAVICAAVRMLHPRVYARNAP
jgi:inosine/xanthosine triphosphatase